MKKIAILLPYKENFTPEYAGAVSLLVKDINLKSGYKNNITVYGSTEFKEKYDVKYKNMKSKKYFFESGNIKYAENFLKLIERDKVDLIEIHNRPATFNYLITRVPNKKILIYFHNDPLSLRGSIKKSQRENILNKAAAVIFISEWTKKRFFHDLNYRSDDSKISVIYSSVNKRKFNKHKEKTILFVGKLNPSKGFDLFCDVITKILDEFPDWKSYVIGDEPRAKIDVSHANLIKLGFLNHNEVLKYYDRASIAVGCSKWDEPMGRVGLESSSRGCATIISNKGGLPETITNGIVLNEANEEHLYLSLKKLISNDNYRKKLCFLSHKNFKNNLNQSVNQYDKVRDKIFSSNSKIPLCNIKKNGPLRIMHVTNFAERHDGRLYFVSIGQKISNGFIRSGHSVLNYSDRDIMRSGRGFFDLFGRQSLNKKIITTVKNYNPDLLLLGHADLIYVSTLKQLKQFNKNLKIAQWFEDPLITSGPDYNENSQKVLDKLDFIDSTFVTTSPDVLDFDKKFSKFYYFPIPVDNSVERLKVFEHTTSIYDVFFAMSHGVNRGVLKFGKRDEREGFINKLVKLNPTIKFDIYGLNGRQPIWAESFFNIISKSKMALNLSRGIPKKYYSSNRIASLLGNGLLTFIDEKTKFNNFFSNNELVFYRNIDDLSEKMQKLSSDDVMRKKIAKRGWLKYHKCFNSKIVSDYMIGKIFNLNTKNKTLWDN